VRGIAVIVLVSMLLASRALAGDTVPYDPNKVRKHQQFEMVMNAAIPTQNCMFGIARNMLMGGERSRQTIVNAETSTCANTLIAMLLSIGMSQKKILESVTSMANEQLDAAAEDGQ